MVPRGRDSQPLYIRVSHALSEAIAAHRFPVGSLLPTEEELSMDFGVSRHTIREAIRHLRCGGLLSARRGIGTRVEARQPGADRRRELADTCGSGAALRAAGAL